MSTVDIFAGFCSVTTIEFGLIFCVDDATFEMLPKALGFFETESGLFLELEKDGNVDFAALTPELGFLLAKLGLIAGMGFRASSPEVLEKLILTSASTSWLLG